MPRRPQADLLNLDSLLDTMSNVVGILIVMVAVTQLTVGDAMERIRESDAAAGPVSEDQILETEREGVQLRAQLEEVREQWLGQAQASTARRLKLDEATQKLERLQRISSVPEAFGLGAGALSAMLSRDEREVVRLRAAVEADAQLNENIEKAILAARDSPSALRVRLPDPRPAPPGLEPVYVFVRYGRAVAVDIDELFGTLTEGARAAVGTTEEVVTIKPEDIDWIVNHFDKLEVGTEVFRWKFEARPSLHAVLSWRDEGAGETAATIGAGGSDLAGWLGRVDPKRNFVLFYVWSDSFPAYLEARALSEEQGLFAWWEALERDEIYRVNVFGRGPTRYRVD